MGFLRKHFRMVLFLGFAFLRPIPSFGCLSISTPSFSGVTAVGLTLQWNSVCSTAALNYSQLDDDPGFLSPFTQITGGPPSVFGSTAPLIPNTLYFAQVATTSFMAGSVALGSTRTLANLPVALPASVLSSFQLQAQWGTNSNPAGTVFETEISSDGFLTLGSSTATTGASFVFGGLPPNTRYDLRVRAMNDDGVRTVFVPLGSTSTFAEPPGFPGVPFSNGTVSGFRVNWTSGTVRWNPPSTSYEAQISTQPGFINTVDRSTTGLWADFGGLPEGTTYFARVRALNQDGLPTVYVGLGSTATATTPFNTGGSSATIQSPDGSVTVIVASGTFSEDYRLYLSTDPVRFPLESPQTPSQIMAAAEKLDGNETVPRTPIPNALAEIRAKDNLGSPLTAPPSNSVDVSFTYPSSDGETVDGGTALPIRVRTLAVYRLNEEKSLWVRLPSSQVDTTLRTVSASSLGLGVFTLVGQLDTSLETSFAYPVPFRAKRGDSTITFGDLSQLATIRIFSASGRWVKTLEETDGDGELVWDVKDDDGDPLPSGVYFFLIESSADKKRGKLVVIR